MAALYVVVVVGVRRPWWLKIKQTYLSKMPIWLLFLVIVP